MREALLAAGKVREDVIVYCRRLEKDDVAAGGTTVKRTHAVETPAGLLCAYCGEPVRRA
jgi:hypothetical protein